MRPRLVTPSLDQRSGESCRYRQLPLARIGDAPRHAGHRRARSARCAAADNCGRGRHRPENARGRDAGAARSRRSADRRASKRGSRRRAECSCDRRWTDSGSSAGGSYRASADRRASSRGPRRRPERAGTADARARNARRASGTHDRRGGEGSGDRRRGNSGSGTQCPWSSGWRRRRRAHGRSRSGARPRCLCKARRRDCDQGRRDRRRNRFPLKHEGLLRVEKGKAFTRTAASNVPG